MSSAIAAPAAQVGGGGVRGWVRDGRGTGGARHDAADLAGHRDGDQVRDEDRGAELLELHAPDEPEDEPDQEADEAHDAERARPLVDHEEEIANPEPHPASEQCGERDRAVSPEEPRAAPAVPRLDCSQLPASRPRLQS